VRNKIKYNNNIKLLKTNNKIKCNRKLILLKIRIKINKIATRASFNIKKLYLELLFLDLKYYINKRNILSIFSLDSNERSTLYANVLFETLNNFKRDANK